MKPANFPERVNQRRKEALARMEKGPVKEAQPPKVAKAARKDVVKQSREGNAEYKNRDRDMIALREKIEHNTMVGVRTKKKRTGAR